MRAVTPRYHPSHGLGSEYLETCVKCGRRFNLLDVRLDGDGQFRCLRDSYGPDPTSIAEANLLLADYLARQRVVVAPIECYSRSGPV